MHEARDEPLQQLLLREHDDRLAPHARRHVGEALDRFPGADEARQEERPPDEQPPADREHRGEGGGRGERRYVPLAFLISAETAGTTSRRSPMTP